MLVHSPLLVKSRSLCKVEKIDDDPALFDAVSLEVVNLLHRSHADG
jgi:hypothetical protein